MNNIEKLIKLITENPDLPVIPMVEMNVVAGDDYNRWLASFGECRVSDFYISDEIIYTDIDELINDIIEKKYLLSEKSDEEIMKLAEKQAHKLMNKVIIVDIDTPDV